MWHEIKTWSYVELVSSPKCAKCPSKCFLRLRETHNALQLPVFLLFLFFCQRYPEYWGIRSKKLFYRPPNS